jgi:ankyrin repeat protein
MAAASAGHYETVRRLLSGGADKSLKDRQGKTALDLARENKHLDLVALMQEAS